MILPPWRDLYFRQGLANDMRSFRRLYPYLARRRRAFALGMLCLVVANWLDIKVAVLLGDGLDTARLNLGLFRSAQAGLLEWFVMLVLGAALGAALARYWMRWLIIGASREIEFEFR